MTISEALSGLKKRGYTIDFNLVPAGLQAGLLASPLAPDEFEITEVHRFEGESDPDDEAVVYAIESRTGMKGVLLNGYGISADEVSNQLVKKLSIRH